MNLASNKIQDLVCLCTWGFESPLSHQHFPIFPLPTEMLGSTFSVGARSGARDRRSRASHWDKPYWSPAPADSGSRSTRASPHWGSKRLPNTVLAWSLTKETSYPSVDRRLLFAECVSAPDVCHLSVRHGTPRSGSSHRPPARTRLGVVERNQPEDAGAADLQHHQGATGCAPPHRILPIGTTLEIVRQKKAAVVKLAAPSVQSGESWMHHGKPPHSPVW